MKKMLSILSVLNISYLLLVGCNNNFLFKSLNEFDQVINKILDFKLKNIYDIKYINQNQTIKEFINKTDYFDINLCYLLNNDKIFNYKLKNKIINHLKLNSNLVLYNIKTLKVVTEFNNNDNRSLIKAFNDEIISKFINNNDKKYYKLSRQIKFKPYKYDKIYIYQLWFTLIDKNIFNNKKEIINNIVIESLKLFNKNSFENIFRKNIDKFNINKISISSFMNSDFIDICNSFYFKKELNDLLDNVFLNNIIEKLKFSSQLTLHNNNKEIFIYDKYDKRTLLEGFYNEIKNYLIIINEYKEKYLDKDGNIKDIFFQENINVTLTLKVIWNNKEYNYSFNLWKI